MKALMTMAAGVACLMAGSAGAVTFNFTYSTFSGVLATGQLEATNQGGFYSVDNVTGTRRGAAITDYDYFDDSAQSFNYDNGRVSNVDFSYYVGVNNYEVRFPGSGFGTEFTNASSSDLVTSFSLSPVTVAAAVPEPATWTMMMLGVGAVGFAMRRRQTPTTRVKFA